uniref:Uncharacterized protein n=1 Tax=Rhipicephalus microplus TaxID=6941 RepID=A0A6M2DEY9_RHIMP
MATSANYCFMVCFLTLFCKLHSYRILVVLALSLPYCGRLKRVYMTCRVEFFLCGVFAHRTVTSCACLYIFYN